MEVYQEKKKGATDTHLLNLYIYSIESSLRRKDSLVALSQSPLAPFSETAVSSPETPQAKYSSRGEVEGAHHVPDYPVCIHTNKRHSDDVPGRYTTIETLRTGRR